MAGPPGAGKTVFALAAVVKMKVPTLYLAGDTDEDTMAARTVAAITGHPIDNVLQTIEHGLFTEEYASALADYPIRFEYDPSDPTKEDIANSLLAFQELHGKMPSVMVLDNLMNMSTGDSNEWNGLRQAVKDLHYLARKTKMCVIILHHTSEQDPSHIESAPPRTAIQGKVSQLPALVLTMANSGGDMYVGVVKNRHGMADPMARDPFKMAVDFSNNQVSGMGPASLFQNRTGTTYGYGRSA